MSRKLSDIKSLILQNKNLLSNFSYLSLLQFFNILIPFISYPYLIRVLGKETYGLVIYAQVVVSYLLILVSFGFEAYATKEVSINRNNKKKLSEIFSSVLTIKAVFFVIALFLLWIIMLFITEDNGNKLLFWLSMWICLNDVLFPTWFFQGLEKMKYITILTLISKSIFLALIFVMIKGPENFLMVPILYGIGAIISGLIAFYIVFKKEGIIFFIPKLNTLVGYIKGSTDFFVSTVFIKLFVSSNKFIIGTFLGLTELAYYDLADKIITLFRNVPTDVVKLTIYPLVAKTKNIKLVKNTTVIMSIYAFFAVVFINLAAPVLIRLLGGENMMPCLSILRLYTLIIITNNLSNYYITIGLWSLGYVKVFRNMMMLSSIFYLLLYMIFWMFDSINLYTVTLTPIIVDVYLVFHIWYFWRKIRPKLELSNQNCQNV